MITSQIFSTIVIFGSVDSVSTQIKIYFSLYLPLIFHRGSFILRAGIFLLRFPERSGGKIVEWRNKENTIGLRRVDIRTGSETKSCSPWRRHMMTNDRDGVITQEIEVTSDNDPNRIRALWIALFLHLSACATTWTQSRKWVSRSAWPSIFSSFLFPVHFPLPRNFYRLFIPSKFSLLPRIGILLFCLT